MFKVRSRVPSVFLFSVGMAAVCGAAGFGATPDAGGGVTGASGQAIATTDSVSSFRLDSGGRLVVGVESRGQFFSDHFVLKKGASQASPAGAFFVRAFGLDVRAASDSALYRVAITGPRSVTVTALQGDADVRNNRGVLVARVMRGNALELSAQDSGATAATQFTGCIQQVGTNYVLRDQSTNVVIQLEGPDVAANVGKTVQISGSPDTSATPISGASQVVQVTALTQLQQKGCRPEIPAAAAATGGAAAGATAAGLSTGATVEIVGGVAAAATVTGLAAAGEFSGGSSSPSTP